MLMNTRASTVLYSHERTARISTTDTSNCNRQVQILEDITNLAYLSILIVQSTQGSRPSTGNGFFSVITRPAFRNLCSIVRLPRLRDAAIMTSCLPLSALYTTSPSSVCNSVEVTDL
jgi:hypothetical protein